MNKFYPEEFKVNRENVHRIYLEKGLKKTLEETAMSGIPLLASLVFITELELEPEERDYVEKYIKDLEKFYLVRVVR